MLKGTPELRNQTHFFQLLWWNSDWKVVGGSWWSQQKATDQNSIPYQPFPSSNIRWYHPSCWTPRQFQPNQKCPHPSPVLLTVICATFKQSVWFMWVWARSDSTMRPKVFHMLWCKHMVHSWCWTNESLSSMLHRTAPSAVCSLFWGYWVLGRGRKGDVSSVRQTSLCIVVRMPTTFWGWICIHTIHITLHVQVLKLWIHRFTTSPWYHKQKIDGVAVNLKALMAVLDQCSISHPKDTL